MGAGPALVGNPGIPDIDGGITQMQLMMDQQNKAATDRSILNIKDQGVKETIQAINTTAKAGHDQQQEVTRNLK
jgi:hypothetical protein